MDCLPICVGAILCGPGQKGVGSQLDSSHATARVSFTWYELWHCVHETLESEIEAQCEEAATKTKN